MARKKIAKADEELDKLATELTLDQIHYQSCLLYTSNPIRIEKEKQAGFSVGTEVKPGDTVTLVKYIARCV